MPSCNLEIPLPASKVPLRPELGSVEHSELYAGYCPPRGDFFDEPDPSADKILNNVTFDVEDLDPLDRRECSRLNSDQGRASPK